MSMRARIVLRAAGSIPNDSKEREQELVNKEVERIKRGNGRKITVRQVLEAFSNGDEVSIDSSFSISLRLKTFPVPFLLLSSNISIMNLLIYFIDRASTSSA